MSNELSLSEIAATDANGAFANLISNIILVDSIEATTNAMNYSLDVVQQQTLAMQQQNMMLAQQQQMIMQQQQQMSQMAFAQGMMLGRLSNRQPSNSQILLEDGNLRECNSPRGSVLLIDDSGQEEVVIPEMKANNLNILDVEYTIEEDDESKPEEEENNMSEVSMNDVKYVEEYSIEVSGTRKTVVSRGGEKLVLSTDTDIKLNIRKHDTSFIDHTIFQAYDIDYHLDWKELINGAGGLCDAEYVMIRLINNPYGGTYISLYHNSNSYDAWLNENKCAFLENSFDSCLSDPYFSAVLEGILYTFNMNGKHGFFIYEPVFDYSNETNRAIVSNTNPKTELRKEFNIFSNRFTTHTNYSIRYLKIYIDEQSRTFRIERK